MVGTLVVTLPSSYTDGELMVGHNEERKSYRGSKTALSLVAFVARGTVGSPRLISVIPEALSGSAINPNGGVIRSWCSASSPGPRRGGECRVRPR